MSKISESSPTPPSTVPVRLAVRRCRKMSLPSRRKTSPSIEPRFSIKSSPAPKSIEPMISPPSMLNSRSVEDPV
ncbi:hypothetical protein [Sphingopyxis sp. MSC1_008]|uniref:hypothetical protein n=1 Tax=Sphingopyxis sp. MSC1_008 TaxID=2909265 RepID=UPI0020C01EC8|nr:hypothetical protein [Sphingopyxis sp. MSC1_008]